MTNALCRYQQIVDYHNYYSAYICCSLFTEMVHRAPGTRIYNYGRAKFLCLVHRGSCCPRHSGYSVRTIMKLRFAACLQRWPTSRKGCNYDITRKTASPTRRPGRSCFPRSSISAPFYNLWYLSRRYVTM